MFLQSHDLEAKVLLTEDFHVHMYMSHDDNTCNMSLQMDGSLQGALGPIFDACIFSLHHLTGNPKFSNV